MNLGIHHIHDRRAAAAALVVLFLMSLKQMSGHRTNVKHRKRHAKREDKRKQ